MKTKPLLLLLLLSACIRAGGQNLVPNPSFEEYDTCPNNIGQIRYALNWYNYGTQNPEYYNACSTINYSTPKNIFGYQIPYHGKAYAGIYTYWFFNPNYREYMTTQLISPLVINQKYFVSFKVCLANNISITGGTNKIGALFSTQPYYFLSQNPTFKNFAHMYGNNIITDTLNWTNISGSFIADSAFTYMNIGNFFDTSNFNRYSFNNDPCMAYYYVDYICISTDSLICNVPVGIKDKSFTNKAISINPNPANSSLNIIFYENNSYEVEIVNFLGEAIFSKKVSGTLKENINVSNFKEGIYLIKISSKTNQLIKKIIINH